MGASVFALMALAEPRWNATLNPHHPAWHPNNLVVVMDTSKSMRAMDAGGVSRYEAGVRAMEALLDRSAGWRLALVAFAGEAEVFCPLTTDHHAVRTLLARARPGSVAGRGSDIEAGLRSALPLFREKGNRHILLVSDGEGHSGDPFAATREARKAGIQVHTLLCGSEQGAQVPGEPDLWGNPTFITHQGEPVLSRPQADVLLQIARAGQGVAIGLDSNHAHQDLLNALKMGTSLHVPASGEASAAPVAFEFFQFFLLSALGCVVAESWLALAGRRRRETRFQDVLHFTLQRSLIFVWTGVAITILSGWTWKPVWVLNENAIEAVANTDLARAEDLWRAGLQNETGNPILLVNLASERYTLGQYAEAQGLLKKALAHAKPRHKGDIIYNLGNTHFRLAEQTGERQYYLEALSNYEDFLKRRPDDADAKHNLAVVKERLKRKAQSSKQNASGNNTHGGQSTRNSPTPVGVQTQYRPPPLQSLPSSAEVDAALTALENDERRRQSEMAPPQPVSQPELPDPRRIIEQALNGLDLEKDW
jgi:Ca-activated chloride channel family protein